MSQQQLQETSVVAVRAAVYHLDCVQNSWVSVDEGLSRIDLYMSSSLQSFRIVGVSAKTQEVVINSPMFKEIKYQRVSNLFSQWNDTRFSYGLNFATIEEAQSFGQAVDAALAKLLTPNAPVPIGSSRTPSQRTLLPPQNRSNSSDDIPPPPASTTTAITQEDLAKKLAERGRSSTKTSNSTPNSPLSSSNRSTMPPPNSPSSTTASGLVSKAEFEAFKVEITAQFKRELETTKRELLDSISRISSKPIPPPPI